MTSNFTGEGEIQTPFPVFCSGTKLTAFITGTGEEEVLFYRMETPESNIGIVTVARTRSGVPYVMLHDSESSSSLDDRFDSWGKLD
jgi:uncharacterized protein YqjF (DUF2071 family)